MEEDIRRGTILSPTTKAQERIEERLKKAVEAAEERLAYESAHNEDLLKALGIVAEFIQRKKRVCYGGTAMNMLLPESKRFYDPNVDLPDYDFYTPDLDADVTELVRDLKAAGFQDVYHRVGMHEGTKKILVNFVAVADISRIDKELFAVILKRSVIRDGVHYTDPDILRMMMYLELSRPRGEVERWVKVFERMSLINESFPVRAAGRAGSTHHAGPIIPFPVREMILDYVITEQRVLLNGPLVPLYTRGIHRGDARFQIRPGGAVFALSPDPRKDAMALKRMIQMATRRPGIGKADLRLFLHKPRGEIVPERVELRMGTKMVALFVKEVACHSYVTVPLEDGRVIFIGSPEYLITLYLSIFIFTMHWRDILGPNPMRTIGHLIRLAQENYRAKSSQFPPFALSCSGHQVGYASLIRAKVARILAEKGKKAGPSRSSRTRTRKRKTE